MKSKKSGKFKKTLILFLVCLWVLIPANLSWAEEIIPSSPPVEPTAPPSPEAPTITEAANPIATPAEVPLAEETIPSVTPTPTGMVADGNVGQTVVTTEDATNSVVLVTSGNLNQDTGTDATGSASLQENQASASAVLEQDTSTGGNSASTNVGDSQVTTGDANTVGTVITALNTNLEGVSFTEYNIAGEQQGDLILDFSQNCLIEQSESFQSNEAVLENTLVLSSDSGQNQTNLNTQGDSTIQTGEANVAATVLTFLNNNLGGDVALGVVNIFGSLVGDIIIPEEALKSQTSPATNEETSLANFQNNEAEIENNLFLTANTGENEGKGNTDGETVIETGEATADTKTVNVVNNNLVGGSWWLVLINQAGEWVGKIFGAPEGANFAGSVGVEFKEDEDGEITVSNSALQNNNESEQSTKTSEQTQTNEAWLVNNLELSANSGQNQANKNTGGNSTIKTGNARIVASLLNFVNNNLSSQSKILVTVVNVFGRWVGDFLPPGSEKEVDPPPTDNPADESSEIEDEAVADFVIDEEVDIPIPSPSLVARRRQLAAKLLPPNQPEGQVFSVQSEEKPLSPKAIRINLAWLLVTIPLFFLTNRLKKLLF